MRAEIGQIAVLRDGRWLYVTDATPEMYVWESEGGATPGGYENILIGDLLDSDFKYNWENYETNIVHVGREGIPFDKHRGKSVVTDMSEVVSILA